MSANLCPGDKFMLANLTAKDISIVDDPYYIKKHSCWCPGYLYHQDIDDYGIDYPEEGF